jgi:hypothetical protein
LLIIGAMTPWAPKSRTRLATAKSRNAHDGRGAGHVHSGDAGSAGIHRVEAVLLIEGDGGKTRPRDQFGDDRNA